MGALACCNPSKKSDSAWPEYHPKTRLTRVDSYLPPDYEPTAEELESKTTTSKKESSNLGADGLKKNPRESAVARKKYSDHVTAPPKRKKNVDAVPAPMNDSNAHKTKPSSLKDKLASSLSRKHRGSGTSISIESGSSTDFRQSRHHTGSMPSIREPSKKVRKVTAEEVSVKLGGEEDSDSTVAVVELSGWLEKKHPDRLGYQRRWLVVKEGWLLWDKEYRSVLDMSEPSERSKFKNQIDLAELKHVCVVNTTARNKFEICKADASSSSDKSWVFRTSSADECAEWVYAIRTQQAHASKLRDAGTTPPSKKKRTLESALD